MNAQSQDQRKEGREDRETREVTATEDTHTHAFAHPSTILDSIRQFIPDLWNNVDWCNPIVVTEMESFRHGLVGVNIEFAITCFRRVEEHVQIMRGVGLLGEPDSHRRPSYGIRKRKLSISICVAAGVRGVIMKL